MFTERKMEEAIEWLFDLFEPEDYEAYDEEEMGRTGGLYLPEVCIALRDRAPVYLAEKHLKEWAINHWTAE